MMGVFAPQKAPSSAPHQLDFTDLWVAMKMHTEQQPIAFRSCPRRDAPDWIPAGFQYGMPSRSSQVETVSNCGLSSNEWLMKTVMNSPIRHRPPMRRW